MRLFPLPHCNQENWHNNNTTAAAAAATTAATTTTTTNNNNINDNNNKYDYDDDDNNNNKDALLIRKNTGVKFGTEMHRSYANYCCQIYNTKRTSCEESDCSWNRSW